MRSSIGLLLLFVLTGCFELELSVVLKPDGSGTQSMHLGMTDRVMQSVRASARALDASATREDPLAVFDGAKVRADLSERGLVVTNHRTYRDGSREFVDVDAEFSTFASLQGSTLFGSSGEWYLLDGRNQGGVRLVFYPRGHAAWLEARDRAAQIATQPTGVQEQFFASQKKRLAGFDTSLVIELPGDIDYASANLEVVGQRKVKAAVRATDIATAADLVRALAPRFEVEFDGTTCMIRRDVKDPGMDRPQTEGTR